MKAHDQAVPQALAAPAGDSRRPYERPRLVELGSIEELTRGGQGSIPDGSLGRKRVGG